MQQEDELRDLIKPYKTLFGALKELAWFINSRLVLLDEVLTFLTIHENAIQTMFDQQVDLPADIDTNQVKASIHHLKLILQDLEEGIPVGLTDLSIPFTQEKLSEALDWFTGTFSGKYADHLSRLMQNISYVAVYSDYLIKSYEEQAKQAQDKLASPKKSNNPIARLFNQLSAHVKSWLNDQPLPTAKELQDRILSENVPLSLTDLSTFTEKETGIGVQFLTRLPLLFSEIKKNTQVINEDKEQSLLPEIEIVSTALHELSKSSSNHMNAYLGTQETAHNLTKPWVYEEYRIVQGELSTIIKKIESIGHSEEDSKKICYCLLEEKQGKQMLTPITLTPSGKPMVHQAKSVKLSDKEFFTVSSFTDNAKPISFSNNLKGNIVSYSCGAKYLFHLLTRDDQDALTKTLDLNELGRSFELDEKVTESKQVLSTLNHQPVKIQVPLQEKIIKNEDSLNSPEKEIQHAPIKLNANVLEKKNIKTKKPVGSFVSSMVQQIEEKTQNTPPLITQSAKEEPSASPSTKKRYDAVLGEINPETSSEKTVDTLTGEPLTVTDLIEEKPSANPLAKKKHYDAILGEIALEASPEPEETINTLSNPPITSSREVTPMGSRSSGNLGVIKTLEAFGYKQQPEKPNNWKHDQGLSYDKISKKLTVDPDKIIMDDQSMILLIMSCFAAYGKHTTITASLDGLEEMRRFIDPILVKQAISEYNTVLIDTGKEPLDENISLIDYFSNIKFKDASTQRAYDYHSVQALEYEKKHEDEDFSQHSRMGMRSPTTF